MGASIFPSWSQRQRTVEPLSSSGTRMELTQLHINDQSIDAFTKPYSIIGRLIPSRGTPVPVKLLQPGRLLVFRVFTHGYKRLRVTSSLLPLKGFPLRSNCYFFFQVSSPLTTFDSRDDLLG